jgi:hypothetical protein
MFKRATWLGVGFTLGVGTTVVAARKARRQLDRYKPNAMLGRATDRAASVRDQLTAALNDGRRAAREREAQLRARGPAWEQDARRAEGADGVSEQLCPPDETRLGEPRLSRRRRRAGARPDQGRNSETIGGHLGP